jgi:4-amino-4-deoxy-L-arabinose transferase-like glycosyltransferase
MLTIHHSPLTTHHPPLTTHHSPLTRTDWLLIGVLFALVLPLRLWLLYNTEVTARDSIGYIRYALQFEQYPWQEVLKKNHQHPGYPVLLWLMSLPVRAIDGATTPQNMEQSAQLVNLLAALVLIVPMYFLGRQFFDRAISFWAVLLYQYLPISAQHLSDGLSEPIFLALVLTGLLQAVHAIAERAIWRCVLCGLLTGLAYLTRPEGALILPAFACALVVMQLLPKWRSSWRLFFACGFTAALSAALVGSIYFIATGLITNKPSARMTIGIAALVSPDSHPGQADTRSALAHTSRKRERRETNEVGNPAAGHLFAATFPKVGSTALRLPRCIWALASEIIHGFHYVGCVPALLGLCWTFGALRRQRGFWVVLAYTLLHSFLLIALAMSVSYVSDRHVMILVLLGCFFAVAGLRELPRRVLTTHYSPLLTTHDSPWTTWYRSARVWFGIFLFALFAICLPKATQRLHGNRAGNHEAGLWLAKHVAPDDNANIVDDHSWSHFFSGLIFQEGREPAFARDHPSKCYVVTTRSRDPLVDSVRQSATIAKDAEVVYYWPEHDDIDNARVLVHVQPRRYEEYPWPLAKK